MYLDTESLFAQIATELCLTEARAQRFQAFDPATGAVIFFAAMEELVAWVRS